MKVLFCRSSNPTSRHSSFWQIRSFTLTSTLINWAGNQRLIAGVGSNPKFVKARVFSKYLNELCGSVKIAN